jgi:Curli production assembly/transport component CsgG
VLSKVRSNGVLKIAKCGQVISLSGIHGVNAQKGAHAHAGECLVISRRTFLSSAVLPLATTVAGCASVNVPVAAERLNGKSVAVASTAGSTVRLQWIGTTVLNNEAREFAFPQDQLNSAIEQTIVEILRGANRYSNVATISARSEPLKGAAAMRADYLLLAEEGVVADPRFQTNQSFRGIGLFQHTMFGSSPQAYGHVALQVKLIDVRTGEVVAREVNSWPSDVFLSADAGLSGEDSEALKRKLLFRAPGVAASALTVLGVR